MIKKGLSFLIAFSILVCVCGISQAQQRHALVIGNADYAVGRLLNPVNDARAMGETLSKCGFSVVTKENVNRRQMDEAIGEFCSKLGPGKVGLFYFSGHGVQYEGYNYMLPVGETINSLTDIKYNTVNLNKVLDEMKSKQAYLNILILDACRSNPAGRSFTRGAAEGGLAKMESPVGTIIAFSTAPETTASDGTGQNSPYVKALMENMTTPGLRSEDVFMRVRKSVMKETDAKQTPWENSCITEPFYFVDGSQSATTTASKPDSGIVVIGGDSPQPPQTAPEPEPVKPVGEPEPPANVPEPPQEQPVYNQPSADRTDEGGQLLPWSSNRVISRSDLQGLTKRQLEIARNEIYARHGWIFKRQDLSDYFSRKPWYRPRGSQRNRDAVNRVIDNELNSIEKKNIDIIRAFEK